MYYAVLSTTLFGLERTSVSLLVESVTYSDKLFESDWEKCLWVSCSEQI